MKIDYLNGCDHWKFGHHMKNIQFHFSIGMNYPMDIDIVMVVHKQQKNEKKASDPVLR